MWTKLLRTRAFVKGLFYALTTPFRKYSEDVITRFPNSNFYFRPFFLCEIYMALGLWEPYVRHIFRPVKGDVVLDVGAHIGYYTLKVAQAVGPKGVVIAVEPDPRNFRILQKNVKSSKLQNVELINCALGSSTGYATFRMSNNPLVSQLAEKSQTCGVPLKKVRVMTMDELCKDYGVQRLNWVKIDVEKGASDVLKGGFNVLKNPTKIIIEVPDNKTLTTLAKLQYYARPLTSKSEFHTLALRHYYVIAQKYARGLHTHIEEMI